jgi:hypothetical protein
LHSRPLKVKSMRVNVMLKRFLTPHLLVRMRSDLDLNLKKNS